VGLRTYTVHDDDDDEQYLCKLFNKESTFSHFPVLINVIPCHL